MTYFDVPLQVAGVPAREFVEVQALVDTGAVHSLLPGQVLRRLGIEPVERVRAQVADGRVIEMDIGEARLRLDGRERTVVVLFGADNARPLLGATTLEMFNLSVDLVHQRLVPVDVLPLMAGSLP